jgi:AraC family transcriptional regulator
MASTGKFGGRGFELAQTATKSAIPRHSHPDYALAYYVRGLSRVCVQQNNHCTELRAGDIGIINPGETHEDLETAREREYLTIHIKVEFFQELLEELGRRSEDVPCFPAAKIAGDGHVSRIMEGLWSELGNRAPGHRLIMTSLLGELGIWILRRFDPSGHRAGKLESPQPDSAYRVRKALEFLGRNCAEEFDLGRLAAYSGLSKYYLDRAFRRATGLSPHRYVVALRLTRAKYLLTSTDASISDIALSLGFSDQSHFTNVFKGFTGVTPRRFRVDSA